MKGENMQSPYPRGREDQSLEEFLAVVETFRRANLAAMAYLFMIFAIPLGVLVGMVVAPNNEDVQAGFMVGVYVIGALVFIGLTIWTAVAGNRFLGMPAWAAGVLVGVLSCVPCVPLLFLIWIQLKLTGMLKNKYGVKMGLFAPDKKQVAEVEARLRDGQAVGGVPPVG